MENFKNNDMLEKEEIQLSRQDRINTLKSATEILKKEFVGLDDVVDEIMKSVKPWYITPEVIKRPVIVSLFGMTGTGKSSVVKRLTELLKINNKTLYFDCGREAGSDNNSINSIVNQTCEILGVDSEDPSSLGKANEDMAQDLVYVFDEFQYARTLNEQHEEVVKSSLRPIWKIIDDGNLDLTDTYNYDYNKFCSFLEDLEPFAKKYPGIRVKENVITDPNDVKEILENIGCYVYPWREIPSLERKINISAVSTGETAKLNEQEEVDYDGEDEEDSPIIGRRSMEELEDMSKKKKDPYRPLKLVPIGQIKTIVKRLNSVDFELSKKTIQDLYSAETIFEVYKILKNVTKICNSPKTLNCSRCLVFIIGNLDEAFGVEEELNPDMDADIFNDITSKVTVSDIKEALTQRFRAEQIARIGNNMIKYPTMKKVHFEKIIRLEVERIIKDFKTVAPNLEVIVSEEIYNLLYAEGVYPTQGVRPIFTTIGSMLTPYFSEILINMKEDDTKVSIDIKDKSDWTDREFKVPMTTVILTFQDGRVVEYNYKLQLGSLRNPTSRATRFISGVHESGHAIMMALLTGKAPQNIVAVSTDKGGFCSTYDPEKEGEIDCKADVDNEVMISFGGYLAEQLIYGGDRPEMCLLGSSNDIRSAWRSLSSAVLRVGYFEPMSFSNFEVESTGNGMSSGFGLHSKLIYKNHECTLEEAMRTRWDELKDETYKNLFSEKKLIRKMGLYLGEHGAMSRSKFLEFIDKFGNQLTLEHMERTKENNSSSYYKNVLEDKVDTNNQP